MKYNTGLNIRSIIGFTTLGLIGSLVIAYSTRYGPWVYGDSTIYIMSAKNLVEGRGLGVYLPSGRFDPLFIFAPLYPIILSLAGVGGVDLVLATRLLDISLFGLLIIMECILIHSLTHSLWLSAIAGIFTLTSPLLLDMYTGALSEPLFLFLELLGLLLLCNFIVSNKRWSLLLAAITLGFSSVTRYIGVACIISGCIGLMALLKTPWKQRLFNIVVFIAISGFPFTLLLRWLGANPLGRDPFQAKISIDQFWKITGPFRFTLVDILSNWFSFPTYLKSFTYREKKFIFLFFFLLLTLFLSWAGWKVQRSVINKRSTYSRLILISLMYIFTVVFVACLMFAYVYRDPGFLFDSRHLSPILVPLVIILFTSMVVIAEHFSTRRFSILMVAFLALLLIAPSIPKSVQMMVELHASGKGYTGKAWRSLAVIQEVKKFPSYVPIISNETAVIHFNTGRMPYDIPELRGPDPLKDFIRFGDDFEDGVQSIFREEGAALVIFPLSFYWQVYDLYHEDTNQRIEAFTQGLDHYFSSGSGDIYFYPHE